MRPTHILLALLVAAVWGSNFIFIRFALNETPPFLLCALRFFLVSVPIAFFIPKPKIPFNLLLLYGLSAFGLQFSLLFLGMTFNMPTGLSSILMQIQVFFSLFLAALFLNEKPTKLQIFGAFIAFIGLGLIWTQINHGASVIGFMLEIGAAASWAVANLVTKKISPVNSFSLVAWGCALSTPPVILLSLWLDGPQKIISSLSQLSWIGLISIAYITYISTWFGYGAWNWLMKRYPLSSISPFALLVPVFGMVGSSMVFGEPMEPWKLHAAYFIILGLTINILGPKLISYYQMSKVELYSK